MAEPHRVRDALRASMTAWATLTVRDDQARVTLAPDLDVLAPHLDQIDPAWSLTWACDSVTPPVVRARLTVHGAAREGLATAHTLHDAKLAALAEMARSYGVRPTSDPVWVEYDPEDGANTTELETDTPAPADLPERPLPPAPPRDPQMEKARRHIEDLLEQLKVAGRGGEAARILMRGYGETLEESRAIYKELHAILKG
ncbi:MULTISPECIES: single-stranded DNA-binding protein [Deinococcus]|nr:MULTISPECIES: single-stranded DNA-binding protein [Deinococcus]